MRPHLMLVATLTCCALGGCGQTGALYLPAKQGEAVSKGAAGATSDTATGPAASTPAPGADPAADSDPARKREPRQPAPQ
jgi:predicted small lipoprotein YifL